MDLQFLCDQAIALHRQGDGAQAELLYRQVLDRDPANFTANYFFGAMRYQQGQSADALELVTTALEANPAAADAHTMQGLCLQALGNPEQALASYDRALAIQPNNIEALVNRGAALRSSGKFTEALANYDRALATQPDNIAALVNRGTALQELRRFDEALVSFDKALAIKPDFAAAFNYRGTCLRALDRLHEALDSFDKALAIQPAYFDALHNRGNVLRDMGRLDEALASYNKVIALSPGSARVFLGRGGVLRDLGNLAEALTSYDQAVIADPGYTEAYVDRGIVLRAMGRSTEAVADYDRAIALDPGEAVIHFNRAGVLVDLGRLKEAIASYDRALAIQPDFAYARGDLFNARMQAGDWRDFAEQTTVINAGVRAGERIVLPFVYQAISESPADLQACSIIYAKDRHPPARELLAKSRPRSGKIRIGYVCGEFREHATGYLMAGLFEMHDRNRFEIMAFDNGWNDESPTRRRLEAGFDGFVDIANLSDQAAADRIAAEKIDILVNLNGYCGLGRMSVFARRPAPVQVNYMGFQGTLGAEYMDYILADRFIIPESERRYYSEQVVYLPGSYWVNDNYRPLAVTSPDRASQSLAGAAFVYCNFNQSYKLTPSVFAVWMQILAAAPGSVLWLLESNPDFAENMKQEAARHGVAPNRLVFAKPVPLEQHLARIGLADLFLDTLPYNAHTTAADSLRAGVPLLTCRGTAFAGRVATSLLHAIGLPELVTENWEDYRALALKLSRDPVLLRAMREKLAHNRSHAPLFDTDRFRRHIEVAYTTMLEISGGGENPRSFAVAAETGNSGT
jgi:protein O-GlcNAc transferase